MKRQHSLRSELKALTAFRTHLSYYITVTGLLWICWFLQSGTGLHPWPLYPSLGWGVLVLLHYLGTLRYWQHQEK